MSKLALFDFDGTISSQDSFGHILQVSFPRSRYALGLLKLWPVLLAYKLGLYSNEKAKQHVLRFFFGGMSEADFNTLCEKYARKHLSEIIRPEALEALKKHKENNDRVVIVSASIENWLQPFAAEHGAELIATKMEVENGKITGNLSGPNCYGSEKVKRLRKHLQISDYDEIYAYGDSPGDKEMLAIAHHPNYRPFRG